MCKASDKHHTHFPHWLVLAFNWFRLIVLLRSADVLCQRISKSAHVCSRQIQSYHIAFAHQKFPNRNTKKPERKRTKIWVGSRTIMYGLDEIIRNVIFYCQGKWNSNSHSYDFHSVDEVTVRVSVAEGERVGKRIYDLFFLASIPLSTIGDSFFFTLSLSPLSPNTNSYPQHSSIRRLRLAHSSFAIHWTENKWSQLL